MTRYKINIPQLKGFFDVTCENNSCNSIVQPLSSGLSKGKWYWEVCIPNAGLISSFLIKTFRTGFFIDKVPQDYNLGDSLDSYAWQGNGTIWRNSVSKKYGSRIDGKYGVVMIAFDIDNKVLRFGTNGKWFKKTVNFSSDLSFQSKKKTIYFPAVSVFKNNAGYQKLFIPSAPELLTFSPPNGFSPLEPGLTNLLTPPVFFDQKKNENIHLLKRIISKANREFTFICWKLDAVKNKIKNTKIVTPPLWKKNYIMQKHPVKVDNSFLHYSNGHDSELLCLPINDIIKDFKISFKYFSNISDQFISKGNLLIAKKLMYQAEICNPSSSEIDKKLHWLDSLRTLAFQFDPTFKPKNETITKKKLFDFVYVPTEKCGSSAHLSLLSIHPDSTIPCNSEIQSAFFHQNEISLLNHYRKHIFCKNFKSGIVMDSRISGARQQPSGLVTPNDYAKRLSKIVYSNGFYQAIRNPLKIIRSTYNSNILQYDMGAYKFSYTNPNTIFNREILDVHSFKIDKFYFKKANHELKKIDSSTLNERLEFAIRVPRPYSVGKAHTDFFENWNIIDLDQNGLKKNKMNESYKSLRLNINFNHPLNAIPFRDKTQFVMQSNYLNIKCFGYHLKVFLGRAIQTVFTSDSYLLELAWIKHNNETKEIGLNFPLCIAIDKHNWINLPKKIKRKIHDSQIMSKILENILLPLWIHEYKIWINAVTPYLLKEFKKKTIGKIIKSSGKEISDFLKIHPSVEQNWKNISKFL